MRVVFLGSGRFAVPILDTLQESSSLFPLEAVVTRPPRRARRGRKMLPTPVDLRCAELGIEPWRPDDAGEAGFLDALRSLAADLFIVADFGQILTRELLAIPAIGAFNLHSSLLPRHRGAAPAAHAILAGDRLTGVTLFRIVRQLDAGPVVARAEVEIEPDETTGELNERLSQRATELLAEHLPRFASSDFTETPQDHSRATLAPKLSKQMGRVDWNADADTICRRVRAFNPWPVAYSYLVRDGEPPERTSILRAAKGDAEALAAEPGTVVRVTKTGFQVACRAESVRLLEVQRAGRAAMDAAAYLRGRSLREGDRFIDVDKEVTS